MLIDALLNNTPTLNNTFMIGSIFQLLMTNTFIETSFTNGTSNGIVNESEGRDKKINNGRSNFLNNDRAKSKLEREKTILLISIIIGNYALN